MIKLIVSDIDGTLVKDGCHNINPRMFEVIEALKKKGVLFAAASGRQLPSIRRLFAPVQDNVIFIAENGAYVVCRDTEMSVSPMERELVNAIVEDMRGLEGCFLTASGREATYIETKDEKFWDFLVNGYHNTVKIVDDVLKEDTEIIKLALYNGAGIDRDAQWLIPRWTGKVKVVVAGAMWLDFMDKSVDKGNALARIQKLTGISKEETICFGDNSNDVGMFHQAGRSYAVSTAVSSVQAEATDVIGSYAEESVLHELEKILKSM